MFLCNKHFFILFMSYKFALGKNECRLIDFFISIFLFKFFWDIFSCIWYWNFVSSNRNSYYMSICPISVNAKLYQRKSLGTVTSKLTSLDKHRIRQRIKRFRELVNLRNTNTNMQIFKIKNKEFTDIKLFLVFLIQYYN